MSDKTDVRHKLGLVTPRPPGTTVPADLEDENESRSFGFLRGIRDRAFSLQFLRIKEGDSVAFPYSWLGPTHYHPSTGIQLVFTGNEVFGVRIRGHNLNALVEGISLYDRGILRHRVTFIREVDGIDSKVGSKGDCVVERIEIVRVNDNETMRFLSVSD